MKILFLATAPCLFLWLSSGAQAEGKKFSDQYCIPYCERFCEKNIIERPMAPDGDTNPATRRPKCMKRCVPMCRELGH